MNLPDMHAFVAVAETGSISRAASRLCITQPATTRRLKQFEIALGGAQLIDRSAKPLALTPVGRKALSRCRDILRAVSELEAQLANECEIQGVLRIGIGSGAESVLGQPFDDLRKQFRSLQLKIETDWTQSLLAKLQAEELDCVIALVTHDQSIPQDLHFAKLATEPVLVVASREMKLPNERALRLRDLGNATWILNPIGCGYRQTLSNAYHRAGVPLRIAAEVLGIELRLSLVARHAGLGLVGRRHLETSAQRRKLRVLNVRDFRIAAKLGILRRRSIHKHASSLAHLESAIDFLHARVAALLAQPKTSGKK